MKAGQMVKSRFLKKDDVLEPKLVTIKSLREENVAQEDQAEDLKWTMHFNELDKPMVINSTNIQLCTLALGTDETNDWIGKQIVLYNDPSVAFGGKLTGGIRIRARKVRAAVPVATAPPVQREPGADFGLEDDDLGP